MNPMKFMLIVRAKDSREWQNIGEFTLPALPRIGEHVVTGNRTKNLGAYRVVGIFHPAPNQGLIDVLAVYDGDHVDVQNRLIKV
jgi:hypothetical protein